MSHDESFGGLFDAAGIGPTRVQVARLEERIEKLIDSGVGNNPAKKAQLAKFMQMRDNLIAKTAAKKGAALAAASIPGVAGGLASSGIRGMDVVEHEFTPEVIRGYNVEGANQGLRQTSVAPPGSGRLVPINFVQAGSVVPANRLAGGVGALGLTQNLVTISVNWAVLRIVALTTQSIATTVGCVGVMQDFKIGGSPNLFLVEDWVLMDDYDTDKEQFTGLRAYPILISPNTAQVSAAVFAINSELITYAISLVTEVLRDDAFGPGLPGAYAR